MKKPIVIIISLMVLSATNLTAQPRELQPLKTEILDAVLTFFDYDRSIPLDAHIISKTRALGFPREKIVFTGGRGDRVPADLSYPAEGDQPYPLVLLLHTGASSKETWWDPNGYEHGAKLTRILLESGFSVLALDAQNHGERSANIDYVPIPTLYFQNEWWASYRTMVTETTIDHRRALDYLRKRPEFDMKRIGAVGQSMGGLTSLYLAALEPDLKVLVTGSHALSAPWLYPLTAHNFATAIGNRPIMIIAGENDRPIPLEHTNAFAVQVEETTKEVHILQSRHRLPESYIPLAVAWLRRHL